MIPGGIAELDAAISALAAEVVVGVDQRDSLLELQRSQARLDAEIARRLDAFRMSHGWTDDGARSPAAWLSSRTHGNRAHLTAAIRTAKLVADLETTRAAWECGEISTEHATVIASIRKRANADTHFLEYEPVLLAVANTHTAIETLGIAKAWLDALNDHLDREAPVNEQGDSPQRARPSVTFARILDGVGVLNGTLDTESAEIIEKALNIVYRAGHRKSDPRTPAQQRADALAAICSRYLAGLSASGNRPHLMIVTDTETIAGDAYGRCQTANGIPIHPDMARRYACNADINEIQIHDGIPLAMGRTTRTFTSHQYRAMVARDGGCRGPGCDAPPDQCEAHHMHPWAAKHGNTDLDVGFLLCTGYCHRQVHEGGWRITRRRMNPRSLRRTRDCRDCQQCSGARRCRFWPVVDIVLRLTPT